ncbi:MAG: SDR family oxidoreductase [Novosphingobium sp.]|nr:SDR family oxidoreductase [Novosphingobium sp.]
MSEGHKVAFVTGASSGIGRATAEAFIRAGYATALVDRDEALGKQAAEEFGALGECMFIACDVADDAAVESAVAQTVSAYSRIDAAFNGAGIDGEPAMTADYSLEGWDRIMSINLRGVWLCVRHEIRQMLRQGGGAIVNCASSAGLVGVGGLSAYVASKHGVVGVTRSAALEYVRSNIRVNAVCPGMIDTPMWQRSISPEMTEQLLANDPIGRLGQPIEIAEAVLWLCSPAASFVNGQALAVDGGFTVQ